MAGTNPAPTSSARSTAGASQVRMLVLTCPRVDAEIAAGALWSAGTTGVEERAPAGSEAADRRNPDDEGDAHEDVELWVPCAPVAAPASGAQPHDTAFERAVRRLCASSGWRLRVELVAGEHAESWRDHVRPVVIDAQLRLVPAWWPDRPAGPPVTGGGDRLDIRIEPAGSFGLGDHPTTRLCATIVATHCRSHPQLGVLDVGCGSGVLGIVAARLGARAVRAIDVSPAAIVATAANAVRNGVDLIDVDDTAVGDLDGSYDLVVANVLAPALVAMATDLRRLTAPAGVLVVSGILAAGHDHVVAALRPMRVTATDVLDGWAAISLCHPGEVATRR